MSFVIMFILAILPILILGMYIYFKDPAKEPLKLLCKLFIGGILAALLTIIITLIFGGNTVGNYDSSLLKLFFHTLIDIALLEEMCKFIFIYVISYHNKEFDQVYDMVVYSVFVALGFAFIENLIYITLTGVDTAIYRMFFSVPVHASIAVFMGNYLSIAKLCDLKNDIGGKNNYLLLSIFVPILIHGAYDFLIYSEFYYGLVIIIVFLYILYYSANKKIKELSAIDSNIYNE